MKKYRLIGMMTLCLMMSNVMAAPPDKPPTEWSATHFFSTMPTEATLTEQSVTLRDDAGGIPIQARLSLTWPPAFPKAVPEPHPQTDAARHFPNHPRPGHTMAWSTFFRGYISISGLQANRIYDVFLYVSRDADYGETLFTLMDVVDAQAAGHGGARLIPNEKERIIALPSNNAHTGYIAGWESIRPGGNKGTAFRIRVEKASQWAYMPSAVKIVCRAP